MGVKQSSHKHWGDSLRIIDGVHSGWNGAVLVAACTISNGLDAVVVPYYNTGTRDLWW